MNMQRIAGLAAAAMVAGALAPLAAQTKTVTERWFDDETVSHGVNTTISLK